MSAFIQDPLNFEGRFSKFEEYFYYRKLGGTELENLKKRNPKQWQAFMTLQEHTRLGDLFMYLDTITMSHALV
jgi:oligoribonuclease (3'-5' exoribonuclease)